VLVVAAAGALACASCRKTDVRTVVIRVPQMRSEACAERVKDALQQARYGVRQDTLRVDLERRTITIDYDSMQLSIKNIEFIVAEAGFDANEVPRDAEAAAKLPAECR
jgi:copper chaperone CopZ